MANTTSKTNRIIIIIVLVLMLVGSTGGLVAVIMGQGQPTTTNTDTQAAELMKRLQEALDAENALLARQAKELSDQYYPEFAPYEKHPTAFNAQTVKEVTIKDLKNGSGETVNEKTAYRAYYIGWTPDGKVFDSSFEGKGLKIPIEGGRMIEGWEEGILGMKIGGIREIAIPADKAYGETGTQAIKPNTPLKFVVKLIPKMSAEHQAEWDDLNEEYVDLKNYNVVQE